MFQMAKGFVDNTINRVLDSWLMSPFPQSMESNPLFEFTDYFDNIVNDDSVENEGILMAISAHGLQSHGDAGRRDSGGPVAGPSHSRDPDGDLLIRPQPCSCSTSRDEDPPVPLIPFHRRHKVPISVNDSIDVSDSSNSSSSSSSASVTPDADETNNINQQFDDHFDFMDAAVSFAIQNKGLTSFGSVDYG